MKPTTLDLEICEGTTHQELINYQTSEGVGIDWTGYTAAAQIRDDIKSQSARASFATGDGITMSSNGDIRFAFPVTSLTTVKGGVWDMKVTSAAGVVDRLFEGRVIVKPAVTR